MGYSQYPELPKPDPEYPYGPVDPYDTRDAMRYAAWVREQLARQEAIDRQARLRRESDLAYLPPPRDYTREGRTGADIVVWVIVIAFGALFIWSRVHG